MSLPTPRRPRMRLKESIVLVCALLLSGCATVPPGEASERRNVLEAVFRYQLKRFQSDQVNYYLSLSAGDKEVDPDDAFLLRFTDLPRPVRKASECHFSESKRRLVDKVTGESGVHLNTGAVKWISPTKVEVECGWYVGFRAAGSSTYCLERIRGKWTYVKESKVVLTRLDLGEPTSGYTQAIFRPLLPRLGRNSPCSWRGWRG